MSFIPRLTLPLMALAIVALPRLAPAADIALVLTDGTALSSGSEAAHRSRVRAYREAGYRTEEGLDLNRDEMAAILSGFETLLEDADRLVIHLTGRMEAAGGVAAFLPEGAADDSRTAVLTGGVPLALFFDMAAERPGQSLVALGRAAPADADPLPIEVPQGVLMLRGAPEPVSNIVTGAMIGAGLPPTAIDATAAGVVFEGLVSSQLRLGRLAGAVTPPAPSRVTPQPEPPSSAILPTPEEREAALGLTAAERREIQRDLTALGFNTRGVDGIFGAGTRAAIRGWEQREGLAVNGYLTRNEIDRLSAAAAEARAEQEERERGDREAWETARVVDTIAGYRNYLSRYPEGLFAQRARSRITELERAQEDRQAWDRARASDSIAAYRDYLRRYPEGAYAQRARDRIEALGGDIETDRERADRLAWQGAREADTIAAYRAYLRDFPRGLFAERARTRIAELEEEEEQLASWRAQEQALGLNLGSILLIETRLALLGLNPGTVDGRIDDTTRAAIRRFQDQRGLTPTGYLNAATVQRLVAGN